MEKIFALNLFLVASMVGLFAMGYVHQNIDQHSSLSGAAYARPQMQLMASAYQETPYYGVAQLR